MRGATDGEDLHQNPVFGELACLAEWRFACHRLCSGFTWSESQQVSAASVDERTWQTLMTPHRERWERRSTDTGLSEPQRQYARKRAGRLKRAYGARVAKCARAGVIVKCGCKGKRDVRWYTCRQHLVCEHCRLKRARKQRARIRAGIDAAWEATPNKQTHVMLLLTPTAEHSDDFAATMRAVEDGWRAFYKRMNARIGRFPFVWVKEVTPGDDGKGHPHMHIVAIWPRFDWKVAGIHELWLASCPESSHLNIRVVTSPKNAAWYLGKYVSKGVESREFTPELRARVVAGTYGTRWVGGSRRFFVAFVPCCPACGQSVVRVSVEDPWCRDADFPRGRDGLSGEPSRGTQLAIETLSAPDKRSGSCGA